MKEIYFCIKLTENEHYCAEYEIGQFIKENGGTLHYYRKMKTGHIPMYRECKVSLPSKLLKAWNKMLEDKWIKNCIEPIPPGARKNWQKHIKLSRLMFEERK